MLLATVPHTGTMFAKQFLTAATGHQGVYGFQGPASAKMGKPLYWGHFGIASVGRVLALAKDYRPVVMVRDPVLTMLTFRNRDDGPDGSVLLGSWELLLDVLPDALFVPIDLPQTVDERRAALSEMASTASQVRTEVVEDWAERWPATHSRGDYEPKTAYLAGDLRAVQEYMPKEWSSLLGARSWLTPFLRGQGYDLPWL